MNQQQKHTVELTDNQMLHLTRAMETEAAEEAALRLGPSAHEEFVELRGELQGQCGDIEYSGE